MKVKLFLRFCGLWLLVEVLNWIIDMAYYGMGSYFSTSGGGSGTMILFFIALIVCLAVFLGLFLLLSPLFERLVGDKPEIAVIPISMVFGNTIMNIDSYLDKVRTPLQPLSTLCNIQAGAMIFCMIIMCFAFVVITLLLESGYSEKPSLSALLKGPYRLSRGAKMTQNDCYIAGAILMAFFPWPVLLAMNFLFRTLFNPPEWIVLQSQYRVASTIACFVLLYIIESILLYTGKARLWVWLLSFAASFTYCVIVAGMYWISID